MYTIKTMNKIAKEGLDLLKEDFSLCEENNYDGIILRSYNLHSENIPITCKAIARAGAGVNNIPLDKCSTQGIVVMNTPGANANAVKELVLLGVLLSARNVYRASNWVQSLDTSKEDIVKLVEKKKSNYTGLEIQGKKAGVIGLGAIGVLVANTLQDLGMEVYGYDPFLSVEAAWNINQNINKCDNLEFLLENCDFVSLHIPLLESTKRIINKKILETAKDGIKILNFARGGLVCDEGIIEAVESGKVGYYVTDFPNDKLLGYDNIICVPHLGASTPESEENCARMAVIQIQEFLSRGNIKNSVNYPDCDMGKIFSKMRICITHKNVPNMLGQISTILADGDVNIENMINKSKDDLAYTMIDVDVIPNDETVERLNIIEGVYMVRHILGNS